MKTFLKWSWVVLNNLMGLVLAPIPIVLMTLFVWALQIINREWPLANTMKVFWEASINAVRYQIEWAKGNLS